ncbi:MAG: dTMP kinase [Parvularculaceae bacterium]
MKRPSRKKLCGPFITFEGGDGVGKSTQIDRLAAALRDAGHEVVVTREPGGSPGSELIRNLIVNGPPERWSPLADALLLYAARADHLERTIKPARNRGAVVISDRFADSTMAYQGVAGALGPETARALYDLVVGENGPDLTIILDAPPNEGLKRAVQRGGAQRYEAKGDEFQERVREAYLDIAAREPERCVVIDARGSVDEVAAKVAETVRARLGLF